MEEKEIQEIVKKTLNESLSIKVNLTKENNYINVNVGLYLGNNYVTGSSDSVYVRDDYN